MSRIEKPVEEGEKSKCIYCGQDLISRLTDYKGKYPDYTQWQLITERKSHYLKDGGCKTGTPEQAENTASQTHPPALELLDIITKKLCKNEAHLIFHVRREVLEVAKEYEKEPNLGMVWEATALIWSKHFGAIHNHE